MVATVGAGTIGASVAEALATRGYRVLLVDRSDSQLGRALRGIRSGLRSEKLLGEPPLELDAEAVLRRIEPTQDLKQLARTSVVIENITENLATKKALYRKMAEVVEPHTLFCANTSTISITEIASWTDHPERTIGMHLMNPVPMMPMVELIRGHLTSRSTVDIARTLVASLGKQSIMINDSPGFATNRVMMLAINEAIFLLQEGVAETPQEVDRLIKTCFGYKMGPLETADLIGLDTVLHSLEQLYRSFQDDKYRPCPLLRTRVAAGTLGRKTSQGFYPYHRSGA